MSPEAHRAAYNYGPASDRREPRGQQPTLYVISFNENLTKVGRSIVYKNRRATLTHNGAMALTGETLFLIDTEENLNDVEQFVLEEVRGRFPAAGGKEYFKAGHEEVLAVVTSALSGGRIEFTCDTPVAAAPAEDLSEMSGDQLDEAIRRFSMNHGIPVTKVVRWLGADKHTSVIRKTGYVPAKLALDIERLWNRPALLFETKAS